jgi:5,10-methenyltetrahydrofolate synthetase
MAVDMNPSEVTAWRKTERQRLIEQRLAMSPDLRAERTLAIAAGLDSALGEVSGAIVSLYWPFRGEPDLRGWAGAVIARGGRVALPVVVEKSAPLAFRLWKPGDRLERGVWNIPVPAEGEPVLPDVLIAPLVGFDGENFRLGYGGGFFDRTLAAMARKPRVVVGIGYAESRLETIHPQPHDIAMDQIVVA